MYGLVNKAIEDLAVSLAGEAAWTEIASRAGVEGLTFVGLDNYDDALTGSLVDAAGEVLGLPAEKVLEAFGEYWVRYTGREGFGPIMSAMGSTLVELLTNLDALHSRVRLSMPAMRPPSFTLEELPDGALLIHYRSLRGGLAPMVTGLLRGAAELFGQQVEIERVDRVEDGADHDTFRVVCTEAVPAGAAD